VADRARWLGLASVSAIWIARVVAAGVFVVAAVPKVADLGAFAEDVAAYRVFPYWSVNAIAAIVPMIELVAAAALLGGLKRRAGAIVLGALTLGFIALIASVIARGIDLQCGCFGRDVEAATVGWPQLWRDVALLGAIVVAALEPRRSFVLERR
jgi:uncharacterized membrane protein YphA (DoxX/SURF4 family)